MGVDKPNYTQIPNLILDDIMRYMDGAELKVTLAIARHTFGFHRERVQLSITDIEGLTGLSRPAVTGALDVGIRRNMIARHEAENGRFSYSLVINDDVLAASKENLPVKKVYQSTSKESLPVAVNKINQDGKESLPPAVKKVTRPTPVLKKEKESIKEMVGGGDPTNQPVAAVAVNSPANAALASALLIKVGVGGGTAKRLVDLRAFEEIRRQVAGWLPERDAGKADVGALIWRIDTGEWSAPELSPEFKRSELYRQFRTQDERDADEAAELEAQRRIAELEAANPPGVYRMPTPTAPVAPTAPLPPPMAHDDPWAVCLAELQGSLPGVALGYLAGSHLEAAGTVDNVPLYRVVVEARAASSLGWLTAQAGPAIRRKVGSVLGRPVLIEIVAVEAEPAAEVAVSA